MWDNFVIRAAIKFSFLLTEERFHGRETISLPSCKRARESATAKFHGLFSGKVDFLSGR